MSTLKLDAQPRTLTGRKVRQLRTQGLVPVVVYGQAKASVNLQVPARNLDLVLHHGGTSQLVEVYVDNGGMHNVLIREVQRDPVTRAYLHADFYAVDMNQKQEVSVQVVGEGKPAALGVGLMVYQSLDSVKIIALPADIPASVSVDLTGLTLEEPILVSQLPQLPGVEYADDPEEHVFSLITTREETIEEPTEETPAEPEVVGKGKQEEEE